ncbi:CLUMA_CG005623, isoform A [Clunio marinus]|uniref:CLUMA_CG005623, isoform A n=1 Tax=Clunio marinus TaxID=568069 RepID=A0A1J1HVN1_9DIPT|nr:CLUMA_CG005623, isoform A [Clunio marinus]
MMKITLNRILLSVFRSTSRVKANSSQLNAFALVNDTNIPDLVESTLRMLSQIPKNMRRKTFVNYLASQSILWQAFLGTYLHFAFSELMLNGGRRQSNENLLKLYVVQKLFTIKISQQLRICPEQVTKKLRLRLL